METNWLLTVMASPEVKVFDSITSCEFEFSVKVEPPTVMVGIGEVTVFDVMALPREAKELGKILDAEVGGGGIRFVCELKINVGPIEV